MAYGRTCLLLLSNVGEVGCGGVYGRVPVVATALADEKRGREIRRREARLAQLERDYDKQLDRCKDGNRRACDDARNSYAEMQQIIPSIPVEPE